MEKTCLVRLFSWNCGQYGELNLERPSHADLSRRRLSLPELVRAIQLEYRIPSGNETWLLFLDGIHEVREAVATFLFFTRSMSRELSHGRTC